VIIRGQEDKNIADLLATLEDLSKQAEALHARYAMLRLDRQELSVSIVDSLKVQKAGPDYAHTMLDQHLSLASINSSMDICFAKLKNLNNKRGEALAAYRAQVAAKKKTERARKEGSSTPMGSQRSPGNRLRTPDVTVAVSRQWPVNRLREEESSEKTRLQNSSERETEKRDTMIRSSPSPPVDRQVRLPEPTADPEASPSDENTVGGHDRKKHNYDDGDEKPLQLRIKGAKGARVLGQAKDGARDHLPDSPTVGITLPKDLRTAFDVLDIHIPTSPLRLLPSSPPPHATPPPTAPLPSPPARKFRADSSESTASAASSTVATTATTATTAHSRAGSRAGCSSSASVSAEEVQTPREEKEIGTGGLEVAALKIRGAGGREGVGDVSVGVVRVFADAEVDDDLLEYYHGS